MLEDNGDVRRREEQMDDDMTMMMMMTWDMTTMDNEDDIRRQGEQ